MVLIAIYDKANNKNTIIMAYSMETLTSLVKNYLLNHISLDDGTARQNVINSNSIPYFEMAFSNLYTFSAVERTKMAIKYGE